MMARPSLSWSAHSARSVTSNSATLTMRPGTQKSYSTRFPLTGNPASESGHWIDGGSVGPDWANVRATPGLAFGGAPGSTAYNGSTAVLAGTWSATGWHKQPCTPSIRTARLTRKWTLASQEGKLVEESAGYPERSGLNCFEELKEKRMFPEGGLLVL
jgi:hypothetical protein